MFSECSEWKNDRCTVSNAVEDCEGYLCEGGECPIPYVAEKMERCE